MQVLQEQKPVTPLTYIPVGDAVIEPLRRKNANHELLEVPSTVAARYSAKIPSKYTFALGVCAFWRIFPCLMLP